MRAFLFLFLHQTFAAVRQLIAVSGSTSTRVQCTLPYVHAVVRSYIPDAWLLRTIGAMVIRCFLFASVNACNSFTGTTIVNVPVNVLACTQTYAQNMRTATEHVTCRWTPSQHVLVSY